MRVCVQWATLSSNVARLTMIVLFTRSACTRIRECGIVKEEEEEAKEHLGMGVAMYRCKTTYLRYGARLGI